MSIIKNTIIDIDMKYKQTPVIRINISVKLFDDAFEINPSAPYIKDTTYKRTIISCPIILLLNFIFIHVYNIPYNDSV